MCPSIAPLLIHSYAAVARDARPFWRLRSSIFSRVQQSTVVTFDEQPECAARRRHKTGAFELLLGSLNHELELPGWGTRAPRRLIASLRGLPANFEPRPRRGERATR